MADVPRWWMQGDWFDVCSCDLPCPCEFARPPTGGRCEGVLAYHIREGAYGDLRLDDLKIIAVAAFEGNLWTREADLSFGLFIDERADEGQREALQTVFSGGAGGWPATMAELMGDRCHGVDFVPIELEVADDLAHWRAEISGRVVAAAEALSGPTTPEGARVQTLNPPGSEVGPGGAATWGTATENRVDAYGFHWSWAGQSSKHIPFHFSGPA